MSWGSNLDNYSPGYCQHVYHAHNHFQHVYAGDREAMTTDPVTGDYFGGAFVDSSGGVELTLRDGIGAADPSNVGGAVSVLDGTGAGQYRRVVHVSNGSRLRLDTAFDTPLDSTSRVQAERCTCDRFIHPHPSLHPYTHPPIVSSTLDPSTHPHLPHLQVGRFKGRFLFWANTYEDCGGFQFYANVVDGVVARHRFVRAEALLSWGRATSSAGHIYAPNLRIQFTENTVVEGNHLWNWNGSCTATATSNRARVVKPARKRCLGLGSPTFASRSARPVPAPQDGGAVLHRGAGLRPRLAAVRALPPRRQRPVHTVRAGGVARAHQPARGDSAKLRAEQRRDRRAWRAHLRVKPATPILDAGSHPWPDCTAYGQCPRRGERDAQLVRAARARQPHTRLERACGGSLSLFFSSDLVT